LGVNTKFSEWGIWHYGRDENYMQKFYQKILRGQILERPKYGMEDNI
jgi:hypothetical protein